jgi:hypothetical protein
MTTPERKFDVEQRMEGAFNNGLMPDDEFIFTSRFQPPRFENGIPRRMVRELMQLQNLFIYPTREESFGLILPEACITGGCLPVINGSLDVLGEVVGNNGIEFEFGSHRRIHEIQNTSQYCSDIAHIILARMKQNEGIMASTYCRTTYNMDALYNSHYENIVKGDEPA